MEQEETEMKLCKCIHQNEEVMSMNEGISISGAMSVHKAESVHKPRNVNKVVTSVRKWKRACKAMSVWQETRGNWECSDELNWIVIGHNAVSTCEQEVWDEQLG